MESLARRTAKQVCAVIGDEGKKAVCVELITKILIYGDSVKDQVREEMRRTFTEEERRLLREELAKLLR